MNQEKRRNKRWFLFHDARYRKEESGIFRDCMLCDVSLFGAKISTHERLLEDSVIEIYMNIPDNLHPLIVKATVVYIRPKHRLYYDYGLEFSNLRQEDREKIFDYIRKNYPSGSRNFQIKENNKKGGGEKMLNAQFSNDRRIFARIPADLYAHYFDSETNREGYFIVLDISAKGMGIAIKEKIKPGSNLEIWVNIPNSKNPIYTTGKVIWVGENKKASGYRAGICLESADFMNYPGILRT